MFHLAWFVGKGFGLQSWRGTWSGAGISEFLRPDAYIDLAQALERAGFDYIMFEDSLQVADHYQGSMEQYLRHGIECPRGDPTALVSVVGQATKRIGLIPTMSTSFYPPFMAARMLVTLDHLTNGRAGGNLVTSSSHRAAQNFGLDQQMEHDLRYAKADEWVDVVRRLCASWEPGAVVLDKEQGIFADHTKVHPIDFEGRFFKCRGPLNIPPGPQGVPVICQAGGSGAGRTFAARNADTIICVPLGIEAMKQYRDDISAQMIAAGRKPTDCKVIYLVRPFIAETASAARDLFEADNAARRGPGALDRSLAAMSYFAQIDFSEFDLDQPIPDLTGRVNGHQSTTARYAKDSTINRKTLREVALSQDIVASIDLVGTPDTVAQQMGEAMEYVGGDGFFLSMEVDRRTIATIADGLVPALRKRGLVRQEYEHEHLKDNLLAF
jgi:FMN-dependent oxidoreductase (nitrilotriacetate monooxygenase family)